MEPLIIALGIAVGIATGLVPGLHVNLLAAIALTIPGITPEVALGLVAAGTVHTFIGILPATYLGAPADDTAIAVLPAHRLLHEGNAREAVHISLAASMLAATLAIVALWPFRWLVLRPEVLPFLAWVAPAVLIAVPTWVAYRDPRPARAFGVVLLAATLGHISWDWPVAGMVAGAATPLLPLLSGLFGIPTLLWALRARSRPPVQQPAPALAWGTRRNAVRGVAAASITALLPGLTAAVATSIAAPRQRDPRQALAVLSAVNTAHATFALCILWVTGQSRSGLAIAWRSLREPRTWVDVPPADLIAVAATVLLAGAVAVFATRLIEVPYANGLQRIPGGVAEAMTVVGIVTLVAVITGWTGLLLLATASAAGMVPIAAGVPRIHLAGALSIPIAIRLASA